MSLLTSDTVRRPHLTPAHPHLGGLGGLRLLLLLVEFLDGLDLLLELHPPETRNTISRGSGQESVHYRGEGLPVAPRVSIFLSEDLRSPENVFNLLVPAPQSTGLPHHYLSQNLD